MQIHQFVHTLNYGDAISGEALTLQRLLRSRSVKSNIYVVHAHEKVRNNAVPYQNFVEHLATARAAGEEVCVILHYSIASPLNALCAETPGVTKVLIYHNLTPPHWFRPYNRRVYADLVRGREELPGLLQQMDIVLADSAFNAAELEEFGHRGAQVLPLPLDLEKWSVDPNPGITRVLRGHGGRNVLHVGRFAPNKCLEDILKAFYFYHHKIDRSSRLWLVGIDIDTELYSFELRRLISRLHLKPAVNFVGAVADGELRAFYENSHAYLCMSEHEGFCLPLLEAMHFGLPVIAYDATAVGATVGDAGVLVRKKAPAETAEILNIVITDKTLRGDLVRRGRERVAQFSTDKFLLVLEEVLLAKLRELRSEGTTSTVKGSDAAHWA